MSKICGLILPKFFIGDIFSFSLTSGNRKTLGIKEGVFHVFRSKIFCLAEPKNFVGESFRVSLFLGIDKFYASEGCVTIFRQKFLSHTSEKFRRGTRHCFTKFPVSKNYRDKRGGVTFLRQKRFCLTVPKKFVREPFCAVFQKVSNSQKFYG